MHVLVMGGEGQLGRAFRAVFEASADTRVSSWDLPDHDMTDASITDQIVAAQPDVVINAGAWTNVDGAEENPMGAYAANALGPKMLAEGCRRCGAAMVQISTNEVFAGDPGVFYYEYDQPDPSSVYARSKAAGERAVMTTLVQHYIVRIAWLYGQSGNHFPSKIVAAADKLGALRVVDDEYGNPTYTFDVAKAVHKVIQTSRYGVYHLVNEGYASRHEFAAEVLRHSDRAEVALERIKLADWPRPAPPPPHAVLVNQTASALGIRLPDWRTSLRKYLAEDSNRFAKQASNKDIGQ